LGNQIVLYNGVLRKLEQSQSACTGKVNPSGITEQPVYYGCILEPVIPVFFSISVMAFLIPVPCIDTRECCLKQNPENDVTAKTQSVFAVTSSQINTSKQPSRFRKD
jgi:hypothetical protein